jgi:hypothetical protein
LRSICLSERKFHKTCVMTALWLTQACGLLEVFLKIMRLRQGLDEAVLPASFPSLCDRCGAPAIRCIAGVKGSSGWQDVKEQSFAVNERQEIAVTYKAGKKENPARNLQNGPVVRERRDVYRNRRASKRCASGNDARFARKGPCRLKQSGSPSAPFRGSAPALGTVIPWFAAQHFLQLPRLDGGEHPADEFWWNRR